MGTAPRRGGFWTRLAACAIDFATLYVVVRLIHSMAATAGVYIPLEATFLVLFLTYSILLLGKRGATLGKGACGLEVRTSKGGAIGYARASLRETIGKFLSGVCLLLGFLWILLPWAKRGWHDYLARTVVLRTQPRPRHAAAGVALGLVLAAAGLSAVVYQPLSVYIGSRHLSPSSTLRPPYWDRDRKTLSEISDLTSEAEAGLAEWLRDNGQDPVDYVVQVAQQHDVTILGETHFVRENLDFLNRLIPKLYHQAGVNCIAMECINASDNELAKEIVNATDLRQDLILELARRHNWQAWGWKGYWDILETVWELNKGLPPGAKRMRVVGLMPKVDLPSFALSGLSASYRKDANVPVWERLRLARAIADLPTVLLADYAYARNVEKEILDRGERGVVWVGAAHAPLAHRQPSFSGNRESARMGFMLHEQYGGRLAHVLLHNAHSAGRSVARAIEEAVAAAGRSSVGFTLKGSPLGLLRDRASYPFSRQPGACLSDLADGYVLLKPTNELHHCVWMDGYVSKRMFAEYKPFYEMLVDQELSDYLEADRVIASTNAVP